MIYKSHKRFILYNYANPLLTAHHLISQTVQWSPTLPAAEFVTSNKTVFVLLQDQPLPTRPREEIAKIAEMGISAPTDTQRVSSPACYKSAHTNTKQISALENLIRRESPGGGRVAPEERRRCQPPKKPRVTDDHSLLLSRSPRRTTGRHLGSSVDLPRFLRSEKFCLYSGK